VELRTIVFKRSCAELDFGKACSLEDEVFCGFSFEKYLMNLGAATLFMKELESL